MCEKVRFFHFRPIRVGYGYADLLVRYMRGKTLARPAPRGGATVCLIFGPDGNVVKQGMSLCSLKDNFDYRVGREKAYDRACKGEKLSLPSWFSEYHIVRVGGSLWPPQVSNGITLLREMTITP